MKLLRLWRQYDSIKAAVMLAALALFLAWDCTRAAAAYAKLLRTPAEYACTFPAESVLLRLEQDDSIRAYSRQKTVSFVQGEKVLHIEKLSAAYLSACYGLPESTRTVWANDAAFGIFCGDAAQDRVQLRGTLDGQPFMGCIVRTEALPDGGAFAVMPETAAGLHDTGELRVCLTEPDTAYLEQSGLCLLDPSVQCAAEYEQKTVLLHIRFGALSCFLAVLAAFAFLRIYRDKSVSSLDYQ